MPETKKLFLLDAMALIYRAYFAFQRNPRINSKGLNTSAMLGFTNTLYEILQNEKPTHIGVAFDTMAPTHRATEFVDYKANREKMPEDLSISIPYIKRIIEAFNIPILFVDGYEADDVIGTLAKQAEKNGFFTYMMTPDKDFGQLVSENIKMFKPARAGEKPVIMGVKEVCEKYGLERPEQFIDILALWGDAADNIPGIPGIGEKRAKELIGEFGSLENVIQNSYKLKGKMKENVENFAQQGIESKMLATIVLDVPIEFNEEDLVLNEPDYNALKEIFAELEFRNLASRIITNQSLKTETKSQITDSTEIENNITEFSIADEKSDINSTTHNYQLIDTSEKIEKLISELKSQSSICFDTETTGLDANYAELVGMSFAWIAGEAYYVPIPENYNEAVNLLKKFKSIFQNPEIEKIGQNLKYDISILKYYEIIVQGKLFDTMIAHYLIEPDMRHNMDFLAETYLNYIPVPITSLIGKKGKNQLSMRNIMPDLVCDYACEDADITFQLKEVFEPMLKENKLEKLFNEIEIPLVHVLTAMETEGIKLDVKALNEYSLQLETEIKKLEDAIHEESGNDDFNIASPKQLGEVLFEQLKVTDKPKLTKTKQYSTGEEVLIKLVNKHPIISKILDFRSLSKLKSTYVDALPELINIRTGRIHTSYNQAVAATGRLSSNNPNLQNIPIRTEKGREIRKAFIPRNQNFTLLAADYSQVELRIIASLSKDENMLDAFNNNLDIHTATASKVYNVGLDEVDKDMRRKAKTVNFGIIYGISAFGLSERINISRKEAKEIIDNYFDKYPGIKKYMEKSIEFAKQHGYVETIMGRRRYLRDINSGNSFVRQFAERNAINAPIQGSAADMIKIAMIKIHNELIEKKLKTKMLLQVHDELVFDAHLDELEIVKPIIIDCMKNAIILDVPIEVDLNVGKNWLEAH